MSHYKTTAELDQLKALFLLPSHLHLILSALKKKIAFDGEMRSARGRNMYLRNGTKLHANCLVDFFTYIG